MGNLCILMANLTEIILFVFGLEKFSREIDKISAERFRKTLSRVTGTPVIGVLDRRSGDGGHSIRFGDIGDHD